MTTASSRATELDQVVRRTIAHSTYDLLLASSGDDTHARLTYDGEILERISRGALHEFLSNLVSEMRTIVSLEWQIPLTNLGSTTFETSVGGFEADKTYYLNAQGRIRDVRYLDLMIDAPPDLLIDIDISNDNSNELSAFVAIKVREVWRYHLAGFAADGLNDGTFACVSAQPESA